MALQVPIWRRPRAQLLALTAFLWALVIAVLVSAWAALLPFVLAALAAYVIDPVIARLARARVGSWRVPRAAAVIAVYLVLGLGVYVLAVSIVPQIYREAMRGLIELRDFLASIGPEKVDAWAREIDAFMLRYGIPVDVLPGEGRGGRFHVDLAAGIAEALRDLSGELRAQVGDVVALSRTLLAGTFKTVFFFILLFMLTAFMSMDGPRIIRFGESLVPSAWRGDFRRLLHGIDTGLSGVVRGQLTIMVVNGFLTFLGLLVLADPVRLRAVGARHPALRRPDLRDDHLVRPHRARSRSPRAGSRRGSSRSRGSS